MKERKETYLDFIAAELLPLEVGQKVFFTVPGSGQPRHRKLRVYRYAYRLGKQHGRKFSVRSSYHESTTVTVERIA